MTPPGLRALAGFVLLALAMACSPAPPPGVTLNRGNGGEPRSLDPQLIGASAEANIAGDLMMGLTTEDAAARPIPGAATDWQVSPDGLTWTFHLRNHLWSDGRPVTAADFVFAWRRLLDPKTAAPYAYNLWVLKNARAISAGTLPPAALGVRAPDDRTLVVTLAHPAPYLPQLLEHHSAYPLPSHVVERYGAAWSSPAHYVGNGAFVLKQWVPNDHITLFKNKLFYDAKDVRIDVVNYYPTANSAAALGRFRAGELDTQTPLPAAEIGWLRAHLAQTLRMVPYLGVAYVSINLERPPLSDLRVREALNLAFDRKAIVAKVLRLGEAPAYGMVPPGVANYPGGAALAFVSQPYAARLSQARALMAAAGYGPDRPLRLDYLTTTDPDNLRVAAAVQAMMRAIGVDLTISQADVQTVIQRMNAHEFDLAANSWIADFDDAANFLDLLRCHGGKNYGNYCDPAYDALLDRAQHTADAAARGALLAQAEQTALAAYPWIPMRFMVTRDLVAPYVKGWIANRRDVNRTRWLWIAGKPAGH